jgi:hypothetical protein
MLDITAEAQRSEVALAFSAPAMVIGILFFSQRLSGEPA